MGVSIFFAHPNVVASQLHTWNLLPQPERLTELSFPDYATLPTTFHADDSQVVTFRIHNLEHQTTRYRYTVTAVAAEKDQTLSTGDLTLVYGAKQDISRTIIVPLLNQRVQIQVSLQYEASGPGQGRPTVQTQTIHYWLDKIGIQEGGV